MYQKLQLQQVQKIFKTLMVLYLILSLVVEAAVEKPLVMLFESFKIKAMSISLKPKIFTFIHHKIAI